MSMLSAREMRSSTVTQQWLPRNPSLQRRSVDR